MLSSTLSVFSCSTAIWTWILSGRVTISITIVGNYDMEDTEFLPARGVRRYIG